MPEAATPPFAPPGPGSWELERAHLTGPVTRFLAEIFSPSMAAGSAAGARRYGALLDHIELRFVNGCAYTQVRAVGAPPGASRLPPRPIFMLLARLHPEIRRRVRTSATVFERKLWREDLREWDERAKPETLRATTALLAVDLAALSTEALLEHLGQCRDHLAKTIVQHHRFSLAAGIPVGDLVAHMKEWTGVPSEEVLQLLEGFSPVSAGITEQGRRLRDAVEKDAHAQALLASRDAPADVLAHLVGLPGDTGPAARAYVDLVGYRLLGGVDVTEPYGLEAPELVLEDVRRAVAPPRRDTAQKVAQRVARVRESVPTLQRETFDDLLDEARKVYRLRDERTLLGDLWASGVARRALLEAGRRALEAGRVRAREHFLDASLDEMRALLRGEAKAPSAEELEARTRWRETLKLSDAPARLGPPGSGPPPVSWLPKPARRLARAVDAMVAGMFLEPEAQSTGHRVHGLPVSTGIYEGRARVVHRPSELGRLERGDVLVTEATTPAFNVALPLLGAIVTDRGGLLCHAAIVAREYGIPAVVGSTDATRVIPDGVRVRVDGGHGVVDVLG